MDELNQVQDTAAEETLDMPDDFFGDGEGTAEAENVPEQESQDKPVDEAETPVEETAEEVNEDTDVPFLTITYNKQSKGLSQDEAVEYAQKGMNYDKLYGQYDALRKQEPVLEELGRLARMNSMSVEDYLHNLSDVQTQFEIGQELESLKQRYPESDEEVLRELATLQVNEKKETNERTMLAHQQESIDSRKAEISRQMDVFAKRYPDIDPSKLDMSVYELMKDGFTLLEAYESVNAERRQREEKERASQEKISRQNEENKKRSMGNISNSGTVEKDDFLSAFMSDD
jgi:hypothetical protein